MKGWMLWQLKRRMGRNEAGQTMPLAAVGIFIMVLGVLATLNLGQAVHQKIRLQNTADAAAYSLAAMEARTFNYIAFLNRVQIAHYNTAMVVQSYMTWVGFQIALFGTNTDLIIGIRNAAQVGANTFPHPINHQYRALKQILDGIVEQNHSMRTAALNLYQSADDLGHKIVEAMSIFNRDAVWQTQAARALLLNGHILTGMQGYVSQLDPEINFLRGGSMLLNLLVNGAMNSLEYKKVFDNASGINPFAFSASEDMQRIGEGGLFNTRGDEGAKDAYRIMAELCHATRTPQFVSNRSEPLARSTITFPPTGMSTVGGSKLGQTKFTETGAMTGAEIPAVRTDMPYPEGSYLSSDDFMRYAYGSAVGMLGQAMASASLNTGTSLGDAIAAYERNGVHFRHTGPGSMSGKISPNGRGVITFPPVQGQQATTGIFNHAPWPGFAPYFKFNPNRDRTEDYNQPSTWIFLNKHHGDFQTDGGSFQSKKAPWYANFSWTNGQQHADLDTTIGGSGNSFLFEGVTVLSRGMAYYHRPGRWMEHPNFFNPYWRAKLAPVGQKLQQFWDKYVTQNIGGGDNAAVNVLKGAQMDFFTEAITSIITH